MRYTHMVKANIKQNGEPICKLALTYGKWENVNWQYLPTMKYFI